MVGGVHGGWVVSMVSMVSMVSKVSMVSMMSKVSGVQAKVALPVGAAVHMSHDRITMEELAEVPRGLRGLGGGLPWWEALSMPTDGDAFKVAPIA